jgi:hypothetical protein
LYIDTPEKYQNVKNEDKGQISFIVENSVIIAVIIICAIAAITIFIIITKNKKN